MIWLFTKKIKVFLQIVQFCLETTPSCRTRCINRRRAKTETSNIRWDRIKVDRLCLVRIKTTVVIINDLSNRISDSFRIKDSIVEALFYTTIQRWNELNLKLLLIVPIESKCSLFNYRSRNTLFVAHSWLLLHFTIINHYINHFTISFNWQSCKNHIQFAFSSKLDQTGQQIGLNQKSTKKFFDGKSFSL